MLSDILKRVYCSLFDTHLRYACQVWGQSNSDILVMVYRAQNKALGIINFKEETYPSESLFTETKILNLANIITSNNWLLIFDHLNSSLPTIYDELSKPFKEQQSQYQGSKKICFKYPKNVNFVLWFQIISG